MHEDNKGKKRNKKTSNRKHLEQRGKKEKIYY